MRKTNRRIDVAVAIFCASLGWAGFVLGPANDRALGFEEPIDTVGPVTVRIEGPEEISKPEEPTEVSVVVANRAGRAIAGSLELKLIDRWRAEPAEPVAFRVDGGGTATYRFKVVAGRPTFDAFYPIHAFVKFDWEGRSHTAHPILIFRAKVETESQTPPPVAWMPMQVAPDSRLALEPMSTRRTVIEVFGRAARVTPAGWWGSDTLCGGSTYIRPQTLGGRFLRSITMHPPWRDGLVGTVAVEYPLQLPEQGPVSLRFHNGVTRTGEGDGVTFRVRVCPLDAPAGQLGTVVFEHHVADKTKWTPARADLSDYAGKAIRLQLESHPGPTNNTGWDESYWGDPVLIAGQAADVDPADAPFPAADAAGTIAIGAIARGDSRYEVRVLPGRRGLLDAVVGFSDGERRLAFRGIEANVLGGRVDDETSPMRLVAAEREPCESGIQFRHRFQSQRGPFDLVVRAFLDRDTFKVRVGLENTPKPQPWLVTRLERLAIGQWSESAVQVYAGAGNVIRHPEAFELAFDGHRLATSFVGFDFAGGISMVQACDVPPMALHFRPDRRHYSLHARETSTFTFVPGRNVWEAVAAWRSANDLRPGGGVEKLAGRFVFDLWGGVNYAQAHERLAEAFRYGLTDSAVVWHNWQRWGYDYRLPDICPPNPHLGSTDEFRRTIDLCKKNGVLFALHDNYIDFYPDADGFSYLDTIAFHPDGRPVLAWINKGRDAQSYRYRADRIEPFLRRNLEWIKRELAPDAFFIDVWTSIQPYDYWTADGRHFDHVYTTRTWRRHFSWIREFLGDDAPQISESGHDQLIGHVDGAQTNHLRVGKPIPGGMGWCVWDIPCDDAERTPWFDAAHHDRFVLHGAGYSSRYTGGLDAGLHGIYSDDYMATEVLTGHPAMAAGAFDRNVVRKYWLLHGLMRALALRRIEDVTFVDGDLHRQHVRWSGGGQVWVNRGTSDWIVGDVTLPPFGFLARVPTTDSTKAVEAAIERRDGVIVEWSRSPDGYYVNGRQMVGGPVPIHVRVTGVELGPDSRVKLALDWNAEEPIPAGWAPFIHFVDDADEIVFQAAHSPGRFDQPAHGKFQAKAVSYISDDVVAGRTYGLRVGVYHPQTGVRLRLSGPDDGTTRIDQGTIRLEGEGTEITAVRWTPLEPKPDPLPARWNPKSKPIQFGPIKTAGGFRITREDVGIVVTPLPAGKRCMVRIDRAGIPGPAGAPVTVQTIDVDGKVVATTQAHVEGDTVVVACDGAAFAYRVRPVRR